MSDKEKSVLKEEGVLKAMDKLKKDKFEVSLNPKKFLLEYSKGELEKLNKLDASTFSKEEVEMVEVSKKGLSENIKDYEIAKLEGSLVPLKYMDLQIIKNGVLEALKYSKEFGFDEDIRVKAMIREEHTLTVFLALRKKSDVSKRYYDSLEEIAKETESTIEEVYSLYIENFVMTEQERKNF